MKTKEKHILIVDDDEFILWALKAKFEKAGYKVTISSNIHDAYFKINNIDPSAILLDIMLPDMNGLEFMNLINSKIKDEKIPTILMSSLSQENVTQTAYKLGATGYLTKPFDLDDAVKMVERFSQSSAA
ncbi:MAG: response regulator [Bacteroidia bacterium]